MDKSKTYVSRIKNLYKNRAMLTKKVWVLISKSVTGIFPFLFLQWFNGKFAIVDMIPIKESYAHYIFVFAKVK